MVSLYGHRWVSAYSDDAHSPTGEVWARELANMTREQLKRGLDACMRRADPWPPTLPEFVRLCIGIPSWHEVRLEFAREDHAPHSPFARMMLRHLNLWNMRNASAQEAQKMLRDAYDIAVQARLRGEPEPPELVALPSPEPRPFTPAQPEVAKRHIADISAMFGLAA